VMGTSRSQAGVQTSCNALVVDSWWYLWPCFVLGAQLVHTCVWEQLSFPVPLKIP
jgi:hypothetical protein